MAVVKLLFGMTHMFNFMEYDLLICRLHWRNLFKWDVDSRNFSWVLPFHPAGWVLVSANTLWSQINQCLSGKRTAIKLHKSYSITHMSRLITHDHDDNDHTIGTIPNRLALYHEEPYLWLLRLCAPLTGRMQNVNDDDDLNHAVTLA